MTMQPFELRLRSKAEAEAYYREYYPWLANQIPPDVAYKLAWEILFDVKRSADALQTQSPSDTGQRLSAEGTEREKEAALPGMQENKGTGAMASAESGRTPPS